LGIACGSASELDYEMLLARDLGYINEEAFTLLGELSQLRRMLTTLVQKVEAER